MRALLPLPLVLVVTGPLLAGCTDKPAEPPQALLAIEARNIDSIGIAGEAMLSPLQVRVRNNGRYAEGVRVFWRTESGILTPSVSITDARGIARSVWTLGDSSGEVFATADLGDRSPTAPATFRTVAYEPVSVAIDSTTNGQRATVGTTLPRRLRVQVRNAKGPREGVTVYWSAPAGIIGERSVTDVSGNAETEWRLPTFASTVLTAYALVPGFSQRVVSFSAESRAGAIARLSVVNSTERLVSTRAYTVPPLVVLATDAFGNRVTGAPVVWSVVSGPVVLTSGDTVFTDNLGLATALLVTRGGDDGVATVRATAGADTVRFSVRVVPGSARVTLDTQTGRGWLSGQNGSQPARDTVLLGETIVFGLSVFDYDNHDVTSVGEPAFEGGREFPYANPSEVRITFTKPGLYHYLDSFTGAAGSVLVVNKRAP